MIAVVGATTWFVVADSSSDSSHSASGTTRVVPEVLSAHVGELAPDFTLPTLDGKTLKLSDYRGQPVVLNFWASWCTPCRKEFPLLRTTLTAHPGEFALLGVNTKDPNEPDGRSFAEAQKAHWPNGFDADSAVARGYGVNGLPETFFIDSNGVIVSHVILGLDRLTLDAQLAKITGPASSASTTAASGT